MTKFIIVLYMCSQLSGQCPSSAIPGYQFKTHSACVEYGYRVAYDTFRALEQTEEWSRDYIENNRIAVRFECKAIEVPKDKVPLKKPKIAT
jgi:hypothetical protein